MHKNENGKSLSKYQNEMIKQIKQIDNYWLIFLVQTFSFVENDGLNLSLNDYIEIVKEKNTNL